ncbi:MAG: universal stress protein [Planctomycetes bacterium]|nr:universal stress protein [Planctomycetota bacterium]
MFKRVLVPLDGSALSEAVLPHASRIAALFGAEFVLLRVAPPGGAAGMEAVYTESMLADECERYLHETAARLRGTGLEVRTIVRHGPVAQTIAEEAKAVAADLLAMSTHGRSGVSRWVFGSVTEKVVRLASLPTLLVRPPVRAPATAGEPLFSRVLVPLDGSGLAESILTPLAGFLERIQAEVNLVRVEGGTQVLVRGQPVPGRVAAAQSYLGQLQGRFAGRGMRIVTECRFGRAADEILRYAEERACDLIAMSAHGRSGVSRLLLGSVADKVLRASPIPVLLLRAEAGDR